MTRADVVIEDADLIVTCAGAAPKRGAAQGDIAALRRASIAGADGTIVFVGPADSLARHVTIAPGAVRLDAPGVSRRHAMIRIADGLPTVEDLRSKNGTFVGERRLERASALQDGDIIGVGPVKVTFRALQPTNTTETQQGPGHGDATFRSRPL